MTISQYHAWPTPHMTIYDLTILAYDLDHVQSYRNIWSFHKTILDITHNHAWTQKNVSHGNMSQRLRDVIIAWQTTPCRVTTYEPTKQSSVTFIITNALFIIPFAMKTCNHIVGQCTNVTVAREHACPYHMNLDYLIRTNITISRDHEWAYHQMAIYQFITVMYDLIICAWTYLILAHVHV